MTSTGKGLCKVGVNLHSKLVHVTSFILNELQLCARLTVTLKRSFVPLTVKHCQRNPQSNGVHNLIYVMICVTMNLLLSLMMRAESPLKFKIKFISLLLSTISRCFKYAFNRYLTIMVCF